MKHMEKTVYEEIRKSSTYGKIVDGLSPSNYEYLYIKAEIVNQTNFTLTLKDKRLNWGKWQTEPQAVLPHSTGCFKASGRDSSMSGTDGHVYFICDKNDDRVFNITFDVPYSGSSYVRHEFTHPPIFVAANVSFKSHGAIEVTFTVTQCSNDE